jgi:hypothetical protein
MRTILRLALLVSATAFAACGGGGDPPPQPLARHIDNTPIAIVPLDQKQQMIAAQNDWSVAKYEKAKAEADYNEATLGLQLAKNEVKGAKLKEDSARAEKKSADASADQNRVNQAMRQLRAAEKFRVAHEVRVKYFDAYRKYLEKKVRHATENMYWREALFELAKAKVARANNIAPKGFSYDDYARQEQDRQGRVQRSRDKSEREKGKALEARQKWLSAQGEADTMIGVKNQLPDPMAPAPVQGNDMTKGAGGITIGNEGVQTGNQPPPTPTPTPTPQ